MSSAKLDADTIRQWERDFVLSPWVAQKGLKPVINDSACPALHRRGCRVIT